VEVKEATDWQPEHGIFSEAGAKETGIEKVLSYFSEVSIVAKDW
jgi:hypothetical protein